MSQYDKDRTGILQDWVTFEEQQTPEGTGYKMKLNPEGKKILHEFELFVEQSSN